MTGISTSYRGQVRNNVIIKPISVKFSELGVIDKKLNMISLVGFLLRLLSCTVFPQHQVPLRLECQNYDLLFSV